MAYRSHSDACVTYDNLHRYFIKSQIKAHMGSSKKKYSIDLRSHCPACRGHSIGQSSLLAACSVTITGPFKARMVTRSVKLRSGDSALGGT